MSDLLKIGDEVTWKGCFGMDAPRTAKVIGITFGKYGAAAQSVPWSQVVDRAVVVDLDNNHWAYAEQIRPVVGAPALLSP